MLSLVNMPAIVSLQGTSKETFTYVCIRFTEILEIN